MDGMGKGYVLHAVTSVLGKFPKANTKFYNRGISGNKVYQLANRWDDDCLMMRPDVLSILIGVNDFWHTIDFNYKGSAKTYNDDFRKLLDRTKKTLPNVKLIIGEPFVLTEGTAIKKDKWIPVFNEYQKACKTIAKDYDAVFISYQSIFDEALKHAPTSYWAPDGVHPSMAGNYLMAMAWLDAFLQVAGK
jgi:lysophospholipase L1-like esterase